MAKGKNEDNEDNEGKEIKGRDYMIIVYFVLVVVIWSSIDTLHDLFKNIVVKNLKTNVYIYSAISFIISVSILFCSNGFTLVDCGLI